MQKGKNESFQKDNSNDHTGLFITIGTVIFPASMPVHAAGTWDFYSEDDILHAMASADVDDRILRISLQV